jgi:hypothetical protein
MRASCDILTFMRFSFLMVVASSLAVGGCEGQMQHMTTYRGAAKSLTNNECGQLCWSQKLNLSPNKNDPAKVCSDEAATPVLSNAPMHCAPNQLADSSTSDLREMKSKSA